MCGMFTCPSPPLPASTPNVDVVLCILIFTAISVYYITAISVYYIVVRCLLQLFWLHVLRSYSI